MRSKPLKSSILGLTLLVALARVQAEPSAGRRHAWLEVRSNVELATVTLDDHVVGLTPWAANVLPGRHRLVVSKDGHRAFYQDLDLTAGQALEVKAVLEP